ncbi:hypothetical protein TWF506_006036 [Arthrobotrys conoides]|uniref:PLD phosphodiesterase domain-containing protein n=1 Tax=Arthrobotrys conoides TaxID=74498 RepID=A0AAN8NQZ6_9PEZI
MQHGPKKPPGIIDSMISLISGEPLSLKTHTPSKGELRAVTEGGSFGTVQPSELFSKIYVNILKSGGHDSSDLLSKPIVGALGSVPLTIISTVPDIADHYYNLIVEAKSEIMIFSNFWKHSYAAKRIGDALKVLSKRTEESSRPRVAVKILFDRGSVKHVFQSRVTVTETEWVTLGLPSMEDAPNIDIEVINYHNFPIGTFHSKFMVVDKRIAALNSCNIQDNSNLEMMCQFEGPVVDEIWDHAVSAWGLPTKSERPLANGSGSSSFRKHGSEDALHIDYSPVNDPPPRLTAEDVTQILNRSVPNPLQTDVKDDYISKVPFRSHLRLNIKDIPMVLAPRAPYASFGNVSLNTPQNAAWLSAIYFAKFKIFIQTPDLNAPPVITALLEAVKRGVEVSIVLCLGYNDLGEMLPTQGGHNEWVVGHMIKQLNQQEKTRLKTYWYVGRDMVKPVHAAKHFRTCHIKLMIVDEKIGIQGSGNQDTQSWFHSQELNIVIDSEEVCKQWMEQLVANQNSFSYGRGSELDGIWRDSDGNQVPGYWF